MHRVNIVKHIKINGSWSIRSIPRKGSGAFDWGALPDGRYLIEWYENGRRCREAAGTTSSQALEAQRKKRHELEAVGLGLAPKSAIEEMPSVRPLRTLVDHYLDQIETLKKRNTHRKYKAVLDRFSEHFSGRTFESVQIEELNDYVIALMRKRLSPNTVLHNIIVVAQFFRRYGRAGITRELQLPQKISSLPVEYTEEDLAKFFGGCEGRDRALFSTFLLTGMREQEVQHLSWTDINFRLRTIRVTAKERYGFYPKRWEEREIPVPTKLVELLDQHPKFPGSPLVFPSPTGNREQHMLDHCKQIAKRAGLDETGFDLKTFRSTYATRMLRAGFPQLGVGLTSGAPAMHGTKAKPKVCPERPGPRDCMRTHSNTRTCDECGATPPVLHTPIRAAGRFCAACCPHCGPPMRSSEIRVAQSGQGTR